MILQHQPIHYFVSLRTKKAQTQTWPWFRWWSNQIHIHNLAEKEKKTPFGANNMHRVSGLSAANTWSFIFCSLFCCCCLQFAQFFCLLCCGRNREREVNYGCLVDFFCLVLRLAIIHSVLAHTRANSTSKRAIFFSSFLSIERRKNNITHFSKQH